MKTTLLLMSLGYLGFALYNRYYRNNIQGAVAGIGNTGNDTGNIPGRNMNFDKSTEGQAERGEGLTDESKTGIED